MKFLKYDQEKSKNQSDRYLDCIDNAFDLVEQTEYAMAASYYEKAARALRELQKMKDSKQHLHKKWLEIKQLEGQQVIDKWLMDSRRKA